jgi:hypothetical protein
MPANQRVYYRKIVDYTVQCTNKQPRLLIGAEFEDVCCGLAFGKFAMLVLRSHEGNPIVSSNRYQYKY